MAVNLQREQASLGNAGAIGGLDKTDLAALDLGDGALFDVKQNGVDAVKTGREKRNLRALLAAVVDEGLGVLKAVAGDRRAEIAAGAGDGVAGDGLDVADFVVVDHDGVDDRHLEEGGVNFIFTLGKDG